RGLGEARRVLGAPEELVTWCVSPGGGVVSAHIGVAPRGRSLSVPRSGVEAVLVGREDRRAGSGAKQPAKAVVKIVMLEIAHHNGRFPHDDHHDPANRLTVPRPRARSTLPLLPHDHAP